jgi:hypothetical protein
VLFLNVEPVAHTVPLAWIAPPSSLDALFSKFEFVADTVFSE